ncbi:hypothetical protein Syun_025236 [Stephania yunnanensis]|uniref:Uncharacterized protein n=1 Tax=Stephania yunnanensis TaxID=152371 RepID=A0AAP0HVL3_9MAGN
MLSVQQAFFGALDRIVDQCVFKGLEVLQRAWVFRSSAFLHFVMFVVATLLEA